jgi:hypothetical protein
MGGVRFFPAMLMVTALAIAGCSGDDGDRSATTSASSPDLACAAPPATVAPPNFPDGIPTPSGVAYTDVQAGSTAMTARGFASGSVDDIERDYRAAFVDHPSVTLGQGKVASGGATTLAVSGPSTRGTIALHESCKGRVDVVVALQPLVG